MIGILDTDHADQTAIERLDSLGACDWLVHAVTPESPVTAVDSWMSGDDKMNVYVALADNQREIVLDGPFPAMQLVLDTAVLLQGAGDDLGEQKKIKVAITRHSRPTPYLASWDASPGDE